jgi:hypothetical protein
MPLCTSMPKLRSAVAQFVRALCYISEGRGLHLRLGNQNMNWPKVCSLTISVRST